MKILLTLLALCFSLHATAATYLLLSQTNAFAAGITNEAKAYTDAHAGGGSSLWTNFTTFISPLPFTNAFKISPIGSLTLGSNTTFIGTTGEALSCYRDPALGDPDYNQLYLRVFNSTSGTLSDFKTWGWSGNWKLESIVSDGGNVSDFYNYQTPTGAYLAYDINSVNRWKVEPTVADGASAIAYLFDTKTALTDPDALLATVRNNGTNMVTIPFDGSITTGGNTNRWIFADWPNATVDGVSHLLSEPLTAGREFLVDFDSSLARNGTTGSVRSVIVFIGDSWTINQRFTVPIQNYFQSSYGFGGLGFISANAAGTPVPPRTTRAYSGTWTNVNVPVGGAIAGASISHLDSGDIAATFTTTGIATSMVIHYLKHAGGGSFDYAVDGGGPTTVNTSNATDDTGFTTISGLADATVHTLVISVTSAGTTGVWLSGVEYKTGTEGVLVHNIGWTGSQTSGWISNSATNWEHAITQLAPNLVIITLGVNDAGNNIVPSTTAANLNTLISRIRTAMPTVSIILNSPGDIDNTGNAYPMSQYISEMEKLAATNHVGFINNYKIIGDYATANACSLYANGTHLNEAGDWLIAQHIQQFLWNQYSPPLIGTVVRRETQSVAVGTGLNTSITTPNLTTGYGNTLVGWSAGGGITDGFQNTLLGRASGIGITSGYRNVMAGYNSGYLMTLGSDNIAIGYEAFYNDYYGGNNVAIGSTALRANTTASFNVGVGSGSLVATTTGAANTAIGHHAGDANITGQTNIFIGLSANPPTDSGYNQIVIGNTIGAGTNTTVIGTPNTVSSLLYGYLRLPNTTTAPTGAQMGGANSACLWQSNAVVYVSTTVDGSSVTTKALTP